MKKIFVYCLMLFCAIVLQTSVLPVISPGYIVGDVVLMLVLTGSIIDGFFAFLWWAVFVGIVYDLINYASVGVHALIFLLVVYFVSFFSRRFSVELKGVGMALFVIFIIVATLVSKFVTALSIAWDLQSASGLMNNVGSFRLISLQILYNFVLFIFTFFIFRKTKKFFAID